MAYLNLNYQLADALTWNTGAKYVGDRQSEVGDTRAPLDDYIWGTTKLTWQFHSAASLGAIVENWLDDDAREYMTVRSNYADHLPLDGRKYLLELKASY